MSSLQPASEPRGDDVPAPVTCSAAIELQLRLARRDYYRAYRAKNAEKIAAQQLAWRTANAAKKKAGDAAYQRANPDKAKAANQKYRAANREKYLAAKADYTRRNAEAARVYCRNRRAAPGKLSLNISELLLAEQGGKCAGCCKVLVKFELDHVVAIVNGGPNEDNNIQLLCKPCNRRKGSRSLAEFIGLS